jgi:hypothetical protein
MSNPTAVTGVIVVAFDATTPAKLENPTSTAATIKTARFKRWRNTYRQPRTLLLCQNLNCPAQHRTRFFGLNSRYASDRQMFMKITYIKFSNFKLCAMIGIMTGDSVLNVLNFPVNVRCDLWPCA